MTDRPPSTMRQWVLARRPQGAAVSEDFRLGIEHMPSALISLYDGTNAGVRMVRVDPDAESRPTS